MNHLLDVWETFLSFSKYFLSNTFSQNIDNWSVAFSLCSVYLRYSRDENWYLQLISKVLQNFCTSLSLHRLYLVDIWTLIRSCVIWAPEGLRSWLSLKVP